MVVKLLS